MAAGVWVSFRDKDDKESKGEGSNADIVKETEGPECAVSAANTPGQRTFRLIPSKPWDCCIRLLGISYFLTISQFGALELVGEDTK